MDILKQIPQHAHNAVLHVQLATQPIVLTVINVILDLNFKLRPLLEFVIARLDILKQMLILVLNAVLLVLSVIQLVILTVINAIFL